MNRLPVFRTVLLTVAAIQHNFSSLLAALVVPAVCISIVEAIVGQLPQGFLFALLALGLSSPFYALFAVICHRIVILGSESLVNRYGLFWGDREFRFLGWTIVLFIVSLMIGLFFVFAMSFFVQVLPSGAIPMLVMLVFWIGCFYVYTRLTMIFPAAAVDDNTGFERAWQLTNSNGLRMIAVAFIAAGPLAVLFFGIGYIMPGGALSVLVTEVLGHALMLVSICAISITYRELIRIERERSGDSPTNPPTDSFGN